MSSSSAASATFRLLFIFVIIMIMLLLLPCFCSASRWELLLQNAGIAAMHAAVTHQSNVVFLDRTNIGPSQINLPNGNCRYNDRDLVQKYDCTAHSVLFIPEEKRVRPLKIQTDTWCSSGQFLPDGTLQQTGGEAEGLNKVRTFKPCPSYSADCDWVESDAQYLQDGRWYATNQLLPDGSQIVVGGRAVYTYEFIPSKGNKLFLPFLQQTATAEYDNLYPFVHLLPSGDLFIFANRDSIILDYKTNTVVKKFPTIPGEPRNYPAAGSSVMLPLKYWDQGFARAEILVCGGAQAGAYSNSYAFYPASQSCGRIVATDPNPYWTMQDMPYRRSMGDMLLLPTGDVLIINGAQNGCQGWGFAKNAILNPVTYNPSTSQFTVNAPSTIPRVYHSIAVLLPDTRILVAGSNTHQFYTFDGEFPTELRVEAFSPDYLDGDKDPLRPAFTYVPPTLAYGKDFTVTVKLPWKPAGQINLALLSAPFTTHSFSQGQRMLSLEVSWPTPVGNNLYIINAKAPPYANLAPPAYYMLFAVNDGVPGAAWWVQVTY